MGIAATVSQWFARHALGAGRRVECPSCGALYRIDAARLGGGPSHAICRSCGGRLTIAGAGGSGSGLVDSPTPPRWAGVPSVEWATQGREATGSGPISPAGGAGTGLDRRGPSAPQDDLVRVEISPGLALWVERTPVTNAAFELYLDANPDAVPPPHWSARSAPHQLAAHPVTGVTLRQARAYAAWRGRRLPTSSEWIAVACGGGRRFPWGDEPPQGRCHHPVAGLRSTAPVDAHPTGASPDGVLDLVGNVWEWTEPPGGETEAQVFGGSFRHPVQQKGRVARSLVSVVSAYDYLGFRCVTR